MRKICRKEKSTVRGKIYHTNMYINDNKFGSNRKVREIKKKPHDPQVVPDVDRNYLR